MGRTPEAPIAQSVASLRSELSQLGFEIQEIGDSIQISTPDGQPVIGASVETLEEFLRERRELTPGNASQLISTPSLRRLRIIKP